LLCRIHYASYMVVLCACVRVMACDLSDVIVYSRIRPSILRYDRLLAGHGGNTGGQTVGTVLSALSAGAVTQKDAYRIIGKEALSGLVIGCLLGLAVGAVAHVGMGISVHVATVVACTLPVMSTIAATLGSAIPFGCVFLGLDPSVIAAPAMTSFVDVTGLLAYFLLANYIFSLFGIAL
jgi:magnesium transporter